MLRCGSKNGYKKKDMYLREIGLCGQNMITVICSVVNKITGWGGYMSILLSTTISTLIKNLDDIHTSFEK